MYLYLPFQEDEKKLLEDLPSGLKQLTGHLEKAMELELTPDRRLARADVTEVMFALSEKGFYLQMPPHDVLRSDDSMLRDTSDGF